MKGSVEGLAVLLPLQNMTTKQKIFLMLLDFADTFLHAMTSTPKCEGYWPRKDE